MYMPDIRSAAVAGAFYPEQQETLRETVTALLTSSAARAPAATPKALIVPHAGFIYSGAVAASAYAALQRSAMAVRRVVMFGPAHRMRIRGLAASSAAWFETPLGKVPVDQNAIAAVAHLPHVRIDDTVHAHEHAIEVQLPFLQVALTNFSIVPFAVGDASAAEVADVMSLLWGGPETLLLVSSDLSHYLSYDDATRLDRATVDSILAGRPLDRSDLACGAMPINGLIAAAAQHGLRPELLDLRNSGDTAGDRARVVGYTALAYTEGARNV